MLASSASTVPAPTPPCGLTRRELDAHPTWVGVDDQKCLALYEDVTGEHVCGKLYTSHPSGNLQPYLFSALIYPHSNNIFRFLFMVSP